MSVRQKIYLYVSSLYQNISHHGDTSGSISREWPNSRCSFSAHKSLMSTESSSGNSLFSWTWHKPWHLSFSSLSRISSLDQVHGAIGQLSPSTKFKPQTAFLVNHCSGKEIPLRVCQLAHSINLTCRKKEAKVCERQVNDSWTQGHCIQP